MNEQKGLRDALLSRREASSDEQRDRLVACYFACFAAALAIFSRPTLNLALLKRYLSPFTFSGPNSDSMIRLLASAAALLSVVLLSAPSPAADFRAVHGVNNKGFQKWFNETANAGYRVTFLQGYQHEGTTLFAAVAIKDGNNHPFEVRNDISDATLKRFTDEFTGLGYRVSCLTGYYVDDQLRFAAVWTKGEKQGAWKAANKADGEQYQTLFDHFTGQQLMPTFLNGYKGDDGKPRLGVVFEKGTAETCIARHGLSGADYQKVINEESGKGLRPIALTVYPGANGPLFGLVMQKDGVAWQARHNLTPDQYQQQFNQASQKGLRPLCINAYEDNGELRYAAVWIKDPAPRPGQGENGQGGTIR